MITTMITTQHESGWLVHGHFRACAFAAAAPVSVNNITTDHNTNSNKDDKHNDNHTNVDDHDNTGVCEKSTPPEKTLRDVIFHDSKSRGG